MFRHRGFGHFARIGILGSGDYSAEIKWFAGSMGLIRGDQKQIPFFRICDAIQSSKKRRNGLRAIFEDMRGHFTEA
jgi:hypothetical protein